jgi:hypothetical protein
LPVANAGENGAVLFKEMGINHRDFFRILPQALETEDYQVTGTEIVMGDGDKRLEISLGPEKVRTIALMKLPVTMVTLRLVNYGDDDRKATLARFDLYYRRGGG